MLKAAETNVRNTEKKSMQKEGPGKPINGRLNKCRQQTLDHKGKAFKLNVKLPGLLCPRVGPSGILLAQ